MICICETLLKRALSLWTPRVVGLDRKTLDTESGGSDEGKDQFAVPPLAFGRLPLRTRLGLVGGGQFSENWLYCGERKPPVERQSQRFLGPTLLSERADLLLQTESSFTSCEVVWNWKGEAHSVPPYLAVTPEA